MNDEQLKKHIQEQLNNSEELEEVKKTIHNGNLTVHNVPHLKEVITEGIEKYLIAGHVMYKLTFVFQHMLKHKMAEVDFDEFLFEGDDF